MFLQIKKKRQRNRERQYFLNQYQKQLLYWAATQLRKVGGDLDLELHLYLVAESYNWLKET